MEIEIVAGDIRLYMNGAPIGEGTIELYDMDVIGFGVWRANAEFDNLLITGRTLPSDGDINGNGHLDAGDLVVCIRVALDLESYNPHCELLPLPDGDGDVNAGDILRLQQEVLNQ